MPDRVGPPETRGGVLRLWQQVLDSRSWSVVVEPAALALATLDGLLGQQPRSFCARFDLEGVDHVRALAWDEPWALVGDVTQLSTVRLATLAQRHHVLALDLRADRLVRLPGGNGELLKAFLGGDWIHSDDCVVASGTAAARLVGQREVVA